jgi:hypothetical protein
MTTPAELRALAERIERRPQELRSVDRNAALALRDAADQIERLAGLANDLIACNPSDLDLQRVLENRGLICEVPATEEDCAEELAQEYGIEPGEMIYKRTEFGRALLAIKRKSHELSRCARRWTGRRR